MFRVIASGAIIVSIPHYVRLVSARRSIVKNELIVAKDNDDEYKEVRKFVLDGIDPNGPPFPILTKRPYIWKNIGERYILVVSRKDLKIGSEDECQKIRCERSKEYDPAMSFLENSAWKLKLTRDLLHAGYVSVTGRIPIFPERTLFGYGLLTDLIRYFNDRDVKRLQSYGYCVPDS